MRRAALITAGITAALALLIAVLIAAVFVAGNTNGGRVMIESMTSRLSSGHVRLTGLAGSFPERLTLARLELSDDRGIWLTAERISLRWRPSNLLRWDVRIEDLHAARVDIERAPISAPQPRPSRRKIPDIDVAHAAIDVLELGPSLAGTRSSLAVQAKARLHSRDDLTADLHATRIGGYGSYRLRLRFDPRRIDALLQLHEPAGGPLENLLQLPGLGALSVTMNVSGPRTLERVDLALNAGTLHAQAHGTIDLPARSADVAYAFAAPAMRPRADLEWQRISSSGKWRGGLVAPTAAADLAVEQLRIGDGAAIDTLQAHLSAAGGWLRLHARIGGLRVPGPAPNLFRQDPVNLNATMNLQQRARPLDLSVTHHLIVLHAHVSTAGTPRATIAMTLPNLAPFAALAEQDLHGSAVIGVRLEPVAGGGGARFDADAHATLIEGTAPWAHLLGDRASLKLVGALTNRDINIERLQMAGPVWSVSLAGTARRFPAISPRRGAGAARTIEDIIASLQARWEAKITDLSAWSPALAGNLSMSGKISGSPLALGANLRLVSTLAVHGSQRGTISATLRAEGLPRAPSGLLRAGGDFDGAPLKVTVALGRSRSGHLRALVRRADWKSAHGTGELTTGASLAQINGQLRLAIGDLADLQRLLGFRAQGSVAATAMFAPAGSRTQMQLQLSAHDLVAGQFAGNLQLSGLGLTDALALQAAAQGLLGGVPAVLSSAATLNLAGGALELTAAQLDYRGQRLHLLAPARLSFAAGLSIDKLTLGLRNAQLTLAGRVLPALDLRGSMHGGTPALVDTFVPGLLTAGKIDATAQLTGTFAAPSGQVLVDAVGLRAEDDAALGLPALDVHASARLMGTSARLDARLNAGKVRLLTLTGRAPLQTGGTVDVKINGKLNIDLADALLEARGLHASGVLNIDVSVTGDANAPQIGGTASLAGGTVRDYSHGVNLTHIDAQIVGGRGTLDVKSFSARAGSGAITMTGTIGVLLPGMPVDLHLIAKNARPIASNLVTANINADLHAGGSLRGRIEVKGTVHVNRATIGIPSALPPNVAVLDVRRRGQAPAAPAGKPLVIGVDVAIEAPRQILVQGRGLDAELGGDLHLTGTSDTPLFAGGFDLLRGSFSLAGSRLSFTQGHVGFNGFGLQHDIDPTLDFTAQSIALGVTTTLRITGVADAPKFDFSSNPPLPQDEIMARLLFGESAAQLTALQAAQIGAALATLSGIGGNGGLNPLAKLQKALGLDRLTVGAAAGTGTATTPSSGASIAAGRYISKRVYVEAKQSTTGSSQVQVQVDLTKHLKLQTRLGNGTAITQGTTPENDPGSSIGLSYQFEY